MEQGTAPASLPVARLIWTALLVATGLYFAVLLYLGPRPPAGPLDTIQPVLFVLAAASAIGAVVVHRRIAPGGGGWPTEPAAAQRVLTMSVVCWTLSESLAIFGLVLGMLGAASTDVLPFFLAAVFLLWVTRPRA